MNESKLIHRDIKADNIISSSQDSEWKLCDYGFSKLATEMGEKSKRDLTRVGTPFYMSP